MNNALRELRLAEEEEVIRLLRVLGNRGTSCEINHTRRAGES